MNKKNILSFSLLFSLILPMGVATAADADLSKKGKNFNDWCGGYNKPSIYHKDMYITGFASLATRKVENYYTTIATLKIKHITDTTASPQKSEEYHVYIASADHYVYDLAKTAYLSGKKFTGCMLEAEKSNEAFYLVGAHME